MTNAILRGKPDAGNPHVRFDEGEVASAKPRRGSRLDMKTAFRRRNVKGFFALSCCVLLAVGAIAGERRLSLADYRDKMRGAWIGQIAGVCFGAPTEFKWRDAIIPCESLPKWRPEMINEAFGQDDIYVEMTFLRTLEQYGLDVSIRQAGLDFANSEYPLWCANQEGRMNLRRGIAPPASSHPKFNRCPNDIDYQIEADYAGIISPGCPQEAIRLGNVFGRLMNYGDGVWAGQFVGAMYAEAFFTDDVEAILDAGLAAIPAESDYAKMVRNVRAWRRAFPDDWTKTWQKIVETYSKRRNSGLKDTNGDIDVRLNGAAVVLGLVYGGGDFDRSIEISTRCGWDSDCNPSTVAGVLGCAKGLSKLDEKYTAKIDNTTKFKFTAYNLPGLYAVCEKLARGIVVRAGGRIVQEDGTGEVFVVPVRRPTPDAFVPSWSAPDQERLVFTPAEMAEQRHPVRLPDRAAVHDQDPTKRVQKTLDAMFPGWKTSPNAPDMNPGLRDFVDSTRGQVIGCLLTHPPKRGEAVTLTRRLKVPAGDPRLRFNVASSLKGDFRLSIRVNGQTMLSTTVGQPDKEEWRVHFTDFDFSLEPWVGQEVSLELVNEPTGWLNEAAIWHDLRITANNGTF